jgi:hypothetical protein
MKIFNRAVKVSTVLRHAGFFAYRRPDWIAQVTNDELIKEWWYSRLANVYVRYCSFQCNCPTNELIVLNQFGGDDYRQALQALLIERHILEEADNSYWIDFDAIRADLAKKSEDARSVPFKMTLSSSP